MADTTDVAILYMYVTMVQTIDIIADSGLNHTKIIYHLKKEGNVPIVVSSCNNSRKVVSAQGLEVLIFGGF